MSRDDTFADLMSRLRVGDQDAAARVFSRFVRRLIALAYRQLNPRIGCREDPEDVV
jgi:RNA polymerase sigma-70 factor (ECF subfamily)